MGFKPFKHLKIYFNLIIQAIILALLYFQLLSWHQTLLGFVLLLAFLLFNGKIWQNILRRIFGMNRKTLMTKMLGLTAVFFLLGLLASICIIFYKINNLVIFYNYLTVTIISFLLEQYLQWHKICYKEIEEEVGNSFTFLSGSYLILLIYILLWLTAFVYLIFFNPTGTAVATSPWQLISNQYLWLFFGLTLLSGLFLLAKFKIQIILVILIMQTLLLHSFLPLSHQMPWGGDVWRHLANENILQSGKPILPVLIDINAEWKEIAKIKLPAIFLSPQKYAYSHLWGTSVLISNTLNVSLLEINKWLLPIFWSLILPILLYRLGWLLFGLRRAGLWLIWLSLLPFPLQALGSLALPVSLGLLLFLFTLIFWLQYWQTGKIWQKYLAIFFSSLMLFGYSLYFVIVWILIIFNYFLSLISYFSEVESVKYKVKSNLLKISVLILSILVIPAIEILTKISFIPAKIAWLNNFKQLIGQFSGWFYASAIRPHDIISGNFIFNHTPDYAFVANIFNNWRWWLIPIMIIIWLLVFIGLFRILKSYILSLRPIVLLISTVFGGYIIGWFILEGDRLFTRRLDGVLALLIIILVMQGISSFDYFKFQISNFKLLPKFILISLILGLSWFTTFTYASGPDMRVVSVDEFQVAEYVNKQMTGIRYQISDINCILADTWILLPLESLSSGKIIGGGFPINYQFGQTERVTLLDKFTNNPSLDDLKQMHNLTGSNNCWFVQDVNKLSETAFKFTNSNSALVGDFRVWHEASTSTEPTGLKKGKR